MILRNIINKVAFETGLKIRMNIPEMDFREDIVYISEVSVTPNVKDLIKGYYCNFTLTMCYKMDEQLNFDEEYYLKTLSKIKGQIDREINYRIVDEIVLMSVKIFNYFVPSNVEFRSPISEVNTKKTETRIDILDKYINKGNK